MFRYISRMVIVPLVAMFAVAAGFVISVPGASAQGVDGVKANIREATPSVYIDLLYHKLSGQEPDYEAWAMSSDAVKKASEFDQPIIFTRQVNALKDMYADMGPDDLIVIRKQVNVSDSYSDIQQIIFFKEFGPETFIEYTGVNEGRKYALVLKGIEKYGEINMRRDKAHAMLKRMGRGGDGHVEILIKPLAADAEAPFEFDGEEYWLLMGEVAEFNIWSDQRVKEKVWSDRAPWYEAENPLMDLYSIPKK